MSQGEPWNYQGMPQNTNTGNIQFFNPGQFQSNNQQEFDIAKPIPGADNSQKSALNGQIPGQPAGDWTSWGSGSNWTAQNNQDTNNVVQGHYQNQVQGHDQSSQNQGQVYQNQTEQYQQDQGYSDQGAQLQGQNQYGYEVQGQYFDPSQQFYNHDPNVVQNWPQQQQQQQLGQYNYQQNWNGQENQQSWNPHDNNAHQIENSGSFNPTAPSQDPNMLYQQQLGSDGQNVLGYTGQDQTQGAAPGHLMNQDFYGNHTQESDPLNSSQASDVSYDSTSCTDAESSAASGLFNRSGSEPPLSSSDGSMLNQIPHDRPPEQPGNVATSCIHEEISNESLRTVHDSSSEGMDKQFNPSVEVLSDQLQQTSLDAAPILPPPTVAIDSGNVNGSAQKLPTENNENSESTSPHSDDTHGLSDWEVVPPQPSMSAHHSREGSLDNNNVQFFIGSSKNSSTGSTPLSFHGQNVEGDQGQQQPDGAGKQFDNVTNQANSSALLLPELTPQHSSSPNTLVENQVSTQNTETGQVMPPLPPPAATPPSGGGGGANPFRKGGSRTSSNASTVSEESKPHNIQPNILFHNPPVGGEVTASKFDLRTENRPHLDNTENIKPPSPIMSSSDETVHVIHSSSQGATQKPKPQSPIMPRKESPFQPPQNRRRNLSQSSDSIEEQPKLEEKLQSDFDRGKYDRPSFTREDRNRQPVGRNRRGSGGGSDLEMQDKKASEHDRHRHYESRSRNSSERLRGKPPPGSIRNVVSPRRIQNALQQAQEKRVKHNMSPATTLWADTDLKLVPNVILAPPTPASAANTSKGGKEVREVLSPVENLITSLSEHISKESTPEPAGRDQSSKKRDEDKPSEHIKHHSRELRKDPGDRGRHERNSSIDRELEISRKIEEKESRGYPDRRNRSREGSLDRDRERYDDDDDRRRDGRYRERGRDPYDQYYDPRYRDYRGQYRDPYYGDERYERPRSRESYIDDERTPSRQGQTSRHDRNYYHRGYDQDYYGRQGYYDQYYYDKYYQRDARYTSAYYDEYYKGNPKYNERYPPDSYYDQHYHHGYDGHDNDRYSQRSHSRVNTPGSLSDAGDQDPYGYGSRSSSRQGQGYSEDPYYRGQYASHYGQYDPYYQGQWNGYGYDQRVQEEVQPGRLTPEKYTAPHMRACLGPGGQLIKVLPNRPKDGQTGLIEVHELQALVVDDTVTEELTNFPGPLIRGDTHKNDVLLFCQKKAKACAENINLTDRESAELLWRFLELLIKQNGMVVGTDISDLLLEGHEPTTVEYSMMGMKIAQSLENLEEDLDETTPDVAVSDRSVINRGRSREETTDRFRHLLLYGRKKDALEWSMKNNLWGHALFLASKMDSRTHANVMTRFANNAMKMNDPLQTLYQLMSGRQPAAVTCIVDEKWGDWRPHLAMMLSNHAAKTDLERKSITTLGDTLGSKGLLHASHFCYLMAQINFGSYNKKTSKLVLIGSNHSLPLLEFATNEAIQCTEIYEYAMSLGNAGFYLPNFQYFKFLYASRLAENGFAQEALQYCEIISHHIQQNPALFQQILVKLVYELANRLKYFDPQRLHTGDDAEDPYWLQQLVRISQGFEDGSIQPVSGSVTPMFNYGTRASSESGEVANYTGGDMSSLHPQMYNQENYQSGVQEVGQFDYSHTTGQHNTQQYQDQALSTNQEVYNSQQQQQQQTTQQQAGQNQHQSYTAQSEQQQNYTTEQQQHYGQDQQNTGYGYAYTHPQQHDGSSANQNQLYNQSQEGHIAQPATGQDQVSPPSNQHPHQLHEYHHQNQYNNYPEMGQHNTEPAGQQMLNSYRNHRNSIASTASGGMVEEEDNVDAAGDVDPDTPHVPGSSFDYFGAATTGKIVAPRLRKRTESECSQRSTGSQQVKRQFSDEKTADKIAPSTTSKGDNKQQSQKQSKGWFGGFFSKLKGGNNPNEMNLPDDKDPAIVWDAEKKRWKNTDGTEEDLAPAAPPPTDHDIHSGNHPSARSNSLTTTPSMGPSTGPPPPSGGNRYSKGKGRGARTQYVDVLNPKPTSTSEVPSGLFNVMPTVASAPAIFNPGGGSGGGSGNTDQGGISEEADSSHLNKPAEPQTHHSTAPPTGDISQEGDLSRASSMSSLSREVQQITKQGSVVKQEGSASMPMMFNPAQLNPSQNASGKSGLQKYGQRRVYPK